MKSFKTKWFSKAAAKARISDAELLEAIAEMHHGRYDDLGGGVFKKRLERNRYCSIVLARSGRYWVFAFLFAKNDRANITAAELSAFRNLSDVYAKKSEDAFKREINEGELVEIVHGSGQEV